MPVTGTLIAFTLVAIGVVLVPGPASIFLLAHGIGHGRAAALAAMAGMEVAAIVRLAIVATGLSALLVSSPVAFAAVQWAGVGYLAYLGVQAWRSRQVAGITAGALSPVRTMDSARKGLIVGISNPSMVIFYLALFPQFIDPSRGSQVAQILVLGGVMWLIGAVWDIGFAWASGGIGGWMQRRPRARTVAGYGEGGLYLGLAVWAAVAGLG